MIRLCAKLSSGYSFLTWTSGPHLPAAVKTVTIASFDLLVIFLLLFGLLSYCGGCDSRIAATDTIALPVSAAHRQVLILFTYI